MRANLVFVHAVQISQENKAVYIGWSTDKEPVAELLQNISERTGEAPTVMKEYSIEINNAVNEYISLVSSRLKGRGYHVIDKIDASSMCKLYVIHVNSPESKVLYVGQTSYPIEVRFLQHKNDVKSRRGATLSARIFRHARNVPHSIAYDLILDTSTYATKDSAEQAEATLARNLRTMGYEVYSS